MIDRLMRLAEVQAVTGLGRSMIYKMISEGSFPGSVKLTSRAVAWREAAVRSWVESRKQSRYNLK
ncbi:MAG: prophage regulatory protein [Loktanella salsilacus]|jgi:prophage regulatory protein|uniref:helix-turn-helix transcriptional regulator n=1 Tax=Loktanella salsilacus TaxID=195913 RepID=UPI0030F5683E